MSSSLSSSQEAQEPYLDDQNNWVYQVADDNGNTVNVLVPNSLRQGLINDISTSSVNDFQIGVENLVISVISQLNNAENASAAPKDQTILAVEAAVESGTTEGHSEVP